MSDVLMFYVQARVTKRATDDGLLVLKPDVNVGDTLLVDLYTKHPLSTVKQGIPITQVVIQCMETGGWLPLECLELLP